MRIVCPACQKTCRIYEVEPCCSHCDANFLANGINIVKMLDMKREADTYFDRHFSWVLIVSGILLAAAINFIDATLVDWHDNIGVLAFLRASRLVILVWFGLMMCIALKTIWDLKKKFPELYRCKTGKY